MIRFEWTKQKPRVKKHGGRLQYIDLPQLTIRLGGFIDLRQWYVMRDEDGEFWLTEYELEEWKQRYPEAEFIRLPKWKSMFR